ncbi:MAG TPA: response regulator [Thermoanaerobaculia bacterium]|nr:response regulator [Thermoanaerobaculia bacterium]
MEKPLVLLVDDNEATTILMTALLHKEFELDIVSDGIDALERLKTKNYAAVILDLLMPQLDGYGVLDFLQTSNPELLKRIIVVSAALTRREMAQVGNYRVCDVISKPFEVDTLLASVRRCVGASPVPRGTMISGGMILFLAEVLKHVNR